VFSHLPLVRVLQLVASEGAEQGAGSVPPKPGGERRDVFVAGHLLGGGGSLGSPAVAVGGTGTEAAGRGTAAGEPERGWKYITIPLEEDKFTSS